MTIVFNRLNITIAVFSTITFNCLNIIIALRCLQFNIKFNRPNIPITVSSITIFNRLNIIIAVCSTIIFNCLNITIVVSRTIVFNRLNIIIAFIFFFGNFYIRSAIFMGISSMRVLQKSSMSFRVRSSSKVMKLMATPLRPNRPPRPILNEIQTIKFQRMIRCLISSQNTLRFKRFRIIFEYI